MAQDDTFGTNGSLIERGNGVEPLAAQVISMLCERQIVSAAGVRQIAVDYLYRAVLSKSGFDPARVLDELRGFRLTRDAIIDLYVPQVAIQMGDMWMNDEISFSDVTVGALRLQSLMSEASNELVWGGQVSTNVLHALVVVPEGEQHFLGASVVTTQLRRAGCGVSLAIAETQKQIMQRVTGDRPDMILWSCARVEALESVIKTVKKIKASVENVPVLALGGPLRGNADGIKEQVGVDLVTNATADVVGFCAKRKKALARS